MSSFFDIVVTFFRAQTVFAAKCRDQKVCRRMVLERGLQVSDHDVMRRSALAIGGHLYIGKAWHDLFFLCGVALRPPLDSRCFASAINLYVSEKFLT